MLSSDRHRVFKRLETDSEFVARIREKHPRWHPGYASSESLDNIAWYELKMQRRLVEDTTDKST